MAKKKEEQLSYMQMPLPSGRKSHRTAKRSWAGLNYRHTIDSGALSKSFNTSTIEAPAIVPASGYVEIGCETGVSPIGLFGFGDFLIHIFRYYESIYVEYIRLDENGMSTESYISVLQDGGATEADEYPRCVVQFNVYDKPTDPVRGKFTKKLLIFPDKKSMDFDITSSDFPISDMDVLVKEFTPADGKDTPPDSASHNYYYMNSKTSDVYQWFDDQSDSSKSGWRVSVPPSFPPIKYAAVHASRLFGVDDDRVYASGFNDYTNWNLDSIDEYNESNAWCSPAQSNTKASGKFTGITNFQGHIVCFKRDFMHEIYNTKNPFRIQDIFAEGAIDHRTIQEVGGKLIFVSGDDVKMYTGANPRSIGYNLNMPKYDHAVSGADDRFYYLYCENDAYNKRFFVYDTFTEQWSEWDPGDGIVGFAYAKNGAYVLSRGCAFSSVSGIYRLNPNTPIDSWCFETDLITNGTVNIKHIKKMQMLAEFRTGTNMTVHFLYDDEVFDRLTAAERDERCVYRLESPPNGKKTIRIKPRKTANYGIKLHVEGHGYFKIHELELFIENGGDLYV